MKKSFILLVSVGVLLGLYYNNRSNNMKESSIEKAVAVKTAAVIPKEVFQTIFAIGTVSSNREVSLTTSISRKVTKVLFSDGQFVNKGDLIIQLDDSQEQAEKKNLEAVYTEQKREFTRLHSLKKSNVISEKDYEMQRTKMISAQANLDLINAKIRDLRIEAPFDGKLGLKNISIGDFISAGTEVTTLDDIRTVKIDFYIPEKYIAKLHINDDIVATSEAYENIDFRGKVLAISSRVDKDSRMLMIRGVFNNKKMLLHPGMSLNLNVKFNKRIASFISEKSVIYIGDKKYVYIEKENKAKKVEVQTGKREDGQIEITDGLHNGDIYIYDGLINIKDGSKLNIL